MAGSEMPVTPISNSLALRLNKAFFHTFAFFMIILPAALQIGADKEGCYYLKRKKIAQLSGPTLVGLFISSRQGVKP